MPTQTAAAIRLTSNIPLQRISDLLCSAFEGGSNYWYRIARYQVPATYTFRTDPKQLYKHLDVPLNVGGVVFIEDREGGDGKTYELSLTSIQEGLAVMARDFPRHYADFLGENDDAETGDVFLQCCLFGDVVYG